MPMRFNDLLRLQKTKNPKLCLRAFSFCSIIIFSLLSSNTWSAEGFTGGISPSRFEITAAAGDVVRRSVGIYNFAERPAQFDVKTTDWEFSADGVISYLDELVDNSCRPWVRLERRTVNVIPNPRTPRNFRFEIHVPADVEPQECRFTIMLEGVDTAVDAQVGNIAMPVSGRIAVIVYLAIGGVKPDIMIDSIEVDEVNGRMLPVLLTINNGDAHGRLDGDLVGKDANAETIQFSVATTPIMPGQSRRMLLTPSESDEIAYPINITGRVYTDEKVFTIDSLVEHE